MSLNFYELKDSRVISKDTQGARVKLKHVGMYSTSETAVYAAYRTLVGSSFDGVPLQSVQCDPVGAGLWQCEADFATSPFTLTDSPAAPTAPADGDPLGPTYSFDITAQQVHITQSKQTVFRWAKPASATTYGSNLNTDGTVPRKVKPVAPDTGTPAGGDVGKSLLIAGSPSWRGGKYTITAVTGGYWVLDPAGPAPALAGTAGGLWTLWDNAAVGTGPNYGQAIGVTLDRVEGADIYYPHFEFGISVQVYPFTLPAMRTIVATCGKTNNAAWRGFEEGAVLYLGATGQANADLVWTISHKFAVGENLYAVPISPPEIIVPEKGAWEYLWCVYDPATNAGKVVQTPTAAYVEQVYDAADFTALGLGA